ncbi:SDR family oxidoreductase [Pseudomonas oryzihabitans]|uniref:SDR family oxidoreductase n=1 Tax=Pseudomonas oryzihabitans TaxID=47885 RepID=UPI0020962F84|nr:SDR family oxidoreductase [Pseudomonas psychrotolerans]
MTARQLLIAGASGIIGQAVLDAFAKAGWSITTVGRSRQAPSRFPHLTADLLDPASLAAAKADLAGVTHLFYSALKPNPDPGVEADENAAMLENLVAAVRDAGAPLARITFVQGGKIYGAHLGVYKTPAREDDSRHFPPNLYFRHEDFVRSLEADGIRWTALRPDIVIGHSLGSAMNLGNLIGLYGALCKATGTAMQFPGTEQAYRGALVNVTAAPLLGEAAVWAAEEQHDGAFNLTNGDVFRWSHVWPQLADWFGLDVGEPQPISLAQRLTALKPLWQTLAQGKDWPRPIPSGLRPGPSATSSSMSRRTPSSM